MPSCSCCVCYSSAVQTATACSMHAAAHAGSPEIVCLQPVALIDHLCQIKPEQLAALCGGSTGGSCRCTLEQLCAILDQTSQCKTNPGGSAANTARGLAVAFGVHTALVGACGTDHWGRLFTTSMLLNSVDISRLTFVQGRAGRSAILVCDGQRTMRTFLDPAVTFPGHMLQQDHFDGARWLFMSAYSLYQEGLFSRATSLAHSMGIKVALDLGSHELVAAHHGAITAALEAGHITCCFCNQDEAKQLMPNIENTSSAPYEQALAYLSQFCDVAVVTLGAAGCAVAARAEAGSHGAMMPVLLQQPGVADSTVVDSTGAGDMFAAGFLYGLLRNLPLQRCAELGCLCGAAAVRALGAELSEVEWQWLKARLDGKEAQTAT